MNIFNYFEFEFHAIIKTLTADGSVPAGLDTSRVVFELPRDVSHGDLACNAAMVMAKPAGMKPRDLAELFAVSLRQCDGVISVEIAGPGFINISVKPVLWTREIANMRNVTPAEAVAHPNWDMGAKISVDSATMMNKGLELIEVFHLFPVEKSAIDILVHPQSVIHSLCLLYTSPSPRDA